MIISNNRIIDGINNHEFIPYYQPFIEVKTQKVIGGEILARWEIPDHKFNNTASFINDIIRLGLMNNMTRQLMMHVLLDFGSSLISKIPEHFILNLNVSMSMLTDSVFLPLLIAHTNKLQAAGIVPVFEITESEDIIKFPQINQLIPELREKGMQFAIDDFGTGFANEALVSASQPQFIKIDRHYVSTLCEPESQRFIKQVIALSHQRHAQVIAEGIEDHQQEEILAELGVDIFQGYHFGIPVPFSQFSRQYLRSEFL